MPERRFAPKHVKSALDRLNGRIAEIPVDIADRGEEYVVEADLPGYTSQGIDVVVRPRMIRITATPDSAGRRIDAGRFDRGVRRRMIRLPDPVREKTAEATYLDGVLRITVRKAERSATRRVPVE